ncbi:MAG TPA: DUF305 domain-containing protein [Allosphingosinicella sp.]
MTTIRALFAAASVLAIVSACSGGEPGNQTATPTNETMPADSMSAKANDPNNPYGRAEMQMHERMMAAVGANASETWVSKMIEHHRGAIDMSNVLIGLGGDAPVLAMARKTVSDQGKEIQELERMLQAGGIVSGTTGDANPYRQSDQRMHERMMAATGANPSETWIRKMIEHHRGAVDMSNILIAQGGDPKVLEKARMTAQKQQKEIAELERMLAGGAAAAAPAATAAAPAPEPATKAEPREAAPASKAKAEAPSPAPKAAPKADPTPEPKPAPGAAPKAPAATPNCSPEHRAAGHC